MSNIRIFAFADEASKEIDKQIEAMKEQTIGVEIEMGGDLRELIEGGSVLVFHCLNEVGNQSVILVDAVEKNFKGVLAGIWVGDRNG